MSRVGKMPIEIPAGVTVTVTKDNVVTAKGPKGELSQWVNPNITIENKDNELVLTRPSDAKPHKSMHGLYRSLVYNMMIGVTEGYSKTLELVGTGYRANIDGSTLTLSVGYSHPVVFTAPEDVTFESISPTKFSVKGINKQVVGNLAADIRSVRKPEPYLGKGIKYENEIIRRKEGKAGAAS